MKWVVLSFVIVHGYFKKLGENGTNIQAYFCTHTNQNPYIRRHSKSSWKIVEKLYELQKYFEPK